MPSWPLWVSLDRKPEKTEEARVRRVFLHRQTQGGAKLEQDDIYHGNISDQLSSSSQTWGWSDERSSFCGCEGAIWWGATAWLGKQPRVWPRAAWAPWAAQRVSRAAQGTSWTAQGWSSTPAKLGRRHCGRSGCSRRLDWRWEEAATLGRSKRLGRRNHRGSWEAAEPLSRPRRCVGVAVDQVVQVWVRLRIAGAAGDGRPWQVWVVWVARADVLALLPQPNLPFTWSSLTSCLTGLTSSHKRTHFVNSATQAVDTFDHFCHVFIVFARCVPIVEDAWLETKLALKGGGGGVLLLDQAGEPLDVPVGLPQAARWLDHLTCHRAAALHHLLWAAPWGGNWSCKERDYKHTKRVWPNNGIKFAEWLFMVWMKRTNWQFLHGFASLCNFFRGIDFDLDLQYLQNSCRLFYNNRPQIEPIILTNFTDLEYLRLKSEFSLIFVVPF